MSSHEPTSGPPQPTRPRFGLSLSQLVASALAAASAAFAASFLGVAGTIIGAAVASVIATLASAMYTHSLQRTTEVVHSTVTQWTRTPAVAPVPDPNAPQPRSQDAPRRNVPWARVAVAAGMVLAVTLGALTAVEAIAGKPLATVVGGSHDRGTTLGTIGGSGSSTRQPHQPVTPRATPTHAPSGTPTATPSTTPDAQPSSPVVPTPVPTPSADPSPTPAAGTPGALPTLP